MQRAEAPQVQTVVRLSDLLSADRVKVPLEAETKEGLLRELVDVLAVDECVNDPDEVYRAVLEREGVLSTGIGHGVAIPHGKASTCNALAVAAGVSRVPLDFNALDGEPVRLFFLLIGPESEAGAHIKALSRISRLARRPELRDRLLAARDSSEFLHALREAEAETE